MPNKKITQLVNKTSILSTDLFPIGDATTGQLYKKTVAELQAAIGGAVISVNGKVGTVVLTTDDVAEATSPTNLYFTNTRARASVSATTPLAYNSSTGVFSIPVATTSANGYLSSTDWTTFNGKENVLTFSGPLVRTTNTISIPVATTSVNGYLSSTDWNTFNNKQGALTLTVTGSSGASTLVGTTLNIPTYTLAGLGGIGASFLSGGTGITYNSGTGVIATTITQYTDALARAALSFTAGSGAYNSTTGVITIPTNTSQLTNGASFITLGSLSGGTGITYNSTTGAISYSGTVYTDASIRGLFSGSTGISYNSTTGAISSTITQYTDALARGSISLTTTGTSGASTYNSTTGVLNIPNYGSALSGYLPLTGGTLTGALYGTNSRFSGFDSAYYYENILAIGNSTYNPKIGLSSISGYRWNIRIKDVGGDGQFVIRYEEGLLDALTLNRSGNLGLGVTPSAWGSGYTAIQNKSTSWFATSSRDANFGTNVFVNSTGNYAYIETAISTLYTQYNGSHAWYNAPSGTAGTAITFTQAMTLNASGNLGLGVTPSAWSLGKAIEIGYLGSAIWSNGLNDIQIMANAYYNGGYLYASSGSATRYYQDGGAHVWLNAPSSTINTAITFTQAMTLDASGNLFVGATNSALNATRGLLLNGGTLGDVQFRLQNNNTGTTGTDGLLISLASDNSMYVYNYENAPLNFGTNNSIRATISAAGNLLVGTTTDSGYKLDVNGTGRFTNSIRTESSGLSLTAINTSTFYYMKYNTDGFDSYSNVNGAAPLYLKTGGSTKLTIADTGAATFSSSVSVSATAGGALNIAGNTINNGVVSILKNSTYSNEGSAAIAINSSNSAASVELLIGADNTNNLCYIQTAAQGSSYTSARLALQPNGGSVGIGATSPGYLLHIKGADASATVSSSDGTSEMRINAQSGLAILETISNTDLRIRTNSTERGRITAGGNWLLGTTTDNGERLYVSGAIRATGTITANSDIRLKKNLERIENALEKVGQISGYTYNTIYDDKRHGGVIAQEVDEVFPEIVNKGNDGLLGVEYGNISALLIEALKEATTKIKALESKVEALQNL